MTVKNISNLAASVQARLQNHARASKRPFQELLQYYAMERFLYRLSTTPYRARFVLKGALMLHVWDAPRARATKDLDFLGRVDNSLENSSAWSARSAPSTSSPTAWCSTRLP